MNKILDELLSANCEDLEGDRAINKLQECLQIKPINLEKLCLPDLEAIQTMNLRSSRGNLPERSLISVDSQLQRIENLKSKQDDENSVNPISTPFSMRSPLASLSALTRRISLSNSPGDPFSAHDLDQSSARNPSLFELSNHLSDAVGIAEKLGVSRLMSLLTKDDGTVAKGIKSPKILLGDVDSISKISSSNVLNVPQAGAEAALSETHANMEAKDISGSSTEVEVNEKLSFLEAQADAVAATNVLDDEVHIFVLVILCTTAHWSFKCSEVLYCIVVIICRWKITKDPLLSNQTHPRWMRSKSTRLAFRLSWVCSSIPAPLVTLADNFLYHHVNRKLKPNVISLLILVHLMVDFFWVKFWTCMFY